MLEAVFYSRFHTERGPSIIHQHPPDSIISHSEAHKPLFSWSNISSYIIPPYDLCNQPLSICVDAHRVLAFPVSVEHAKYERTRFTFNVCFVLGAHDDVRPWDGLVRKTAAFFRALEVEDGLLSAEERLPALKWAGEPAYPARGVGRVYPLLARVFDDLRAYGECSARASDERVLNLRLVPPAETAPTANARAEAKVHAWDVPVLVRPLPAPAEWTWELTLRRIHAHIDGVQHVLRIAERADAEPKLVRRAVAELVRARRVRLLDLFHFQAIYACTAAFAAFVDAVELQDECRRYVSSATAAATDDPHQQQQQFLPSRTALIELYAALQPGIPLAAFCLAHKAALAHIDVRRFVTFGVLKGFLRRIHKHALAAELPPPLPRAATTTSSSANGGALGVSAAATAAAAESSPRKAAALIAAAADSAAAAADAPTWQLNDAVVRDFDRAWKKAALSSGWATPPSNPPPPLTGGSLGGGSSRSAEQVRGEQDEVLRACLDGGRCLDQACVMLHMSERKVLERLRAGRFGEVVLFNK